MRWIDKPRKKNAEEVVNEFINFLKIMGIYSKYRYAIWNSPSFGRIHLLSSVSLYFTDKYKFQSKGRYISFLIEKLVAHTRLFGGRLEEHSIMYIFGDCLNDDEIDLLWSYFKEKHIADATIVK